MNDNRILSVTLAALLRDLEIVPQRAGVEAGPEWHAVAGSLQAVWETEGGLLDLAGALVYGGTLPLPIARPLRLGSIFCEIGEAPPPPACYPLRPLALVEEAFFPSTALGKEASAAEYAALWQSMRQAMPALAAVDDLEAALEGWSALLQSYAWCIPAPGDAAAVSLFDHARLLAAVAACLAALEPEAVAPLAAALGRGQPDSRQPVACLVGGDLSGVQQFLYTITARGATPALRGRSFYLQLLTEAAARLVLRRLGLSVANLIYAGGGRFYILAPAGAAAMLDGIQVELDRLLLARHEGSLYLALGGVPLTSADYAQERFAETWREANHAMSERKRRRFATQGAALFTVADRGGDEEQECQVCHAESADVMRIARDEDDATEVRKCALCRSLEDLGRDLRDASALLVAQIPEDAGAPRTWQGALAALGCQVAIRRSSGAWTPLPAGAQRATLLGLHGLAEVDAALRRQVTCPIASGVRWMVNVAPVRGDGERATFEDLQDAALGLGRLGVLRMDVDDLGLLFGQGFRRQASQGRKEGRSAATLARVAALSAALGRYFEGWVGELCARYNREEARAGDELVYAIYSGGDDLFLVGAWDVMPHLAHQIRSDFGRYAAGNPLLHVSGGITLHGGKEPLYQAADNAGDALDAAKARKGKDALNFLGISVAWADWEGLVEQQQKLAELVAESGAAAILSILRGGYRDYLETAADWQARGLGLTQDGQPQTAWGPYLWRLTYQLRRYAARYPAAEALVEGWIGQLGQPQTMTQLALAARWTDALTRTKQDQTQA